MKTFILAIFGLLALANAQDQIDQSEARKANPEPYPNEPKAYALLRTSLYEQPALKIAGGFVPSKYKTYYKQFTAGKDCHKIKCGTFA